MIFIIIIPDEFVRLVLSITQLLSLTAIVTINYSLIKRNETSETTRSTQKNNFEYLQIQFKLWARALQKEDKKLVYIIDELDTIDEKYDKPLEIIKTFKNLFSESLAHYIFIGDSKIYDATNVDREKGDNSYCPTLFTHRIFLSLPSSKELKDYLYEIFEIQSNDNTNNEKETIENLCSYLRYRSGNDFFELKRVLFDLVEYHNNEPYLNINQIIREDPDYEMIVKIYNYVDYSVNKSTKKLKKYWKENFELNRDFFKFLNNNFLKSFCENDLNDNQKKLITFLKRGRIIQESGRDENNNLTYIWTGKIGIPNEDSWFDEEVNFIKKFKDLVDCANQIHELPEEYKNPKFFKKNYSTIRENQDGEFATGISLFSYYKKYNDLKEQLESNTTRSQVALEDSQNAVQEIQNVLESIQNSKYKILYNISKKAFNENFEIGEKDLENQESLQREENIDQQILTGLPGLFQLVKSNLLFRISFSNRSKNVFFLKNFEISDDLKNDLETLLNNKNLLFINITEGLKYKENNLKFSRAKKRGKGNTNIEISNFKMIELKEIKDFGKILQIVDRFFSK